MRVYSQNGDLIVKSDEYFGHDPRLIDVGVVEDILAYIRVSRCASKGGWSLSNWVRIGTSLLPMNKTLGGGLLKAARGGRKLRLGLIETDRRRV